VLGWPHTGWPAAVDAWAEAIAAGGTLRQARQAMRDAIEARYADAPVHDLTYDLRFSRTMS
jgi:predicted RNase H-like HicB family nuclease